jgi:glutathione S-transferase
MSLKVLGRLTSINVRKVLWTCAELDLHFEHVESDAALLAKNPNAMVPVIQDGEFVMWESNAICRYLAGKQPRNTLLPQEAAARGLVEQWMDGRYRLNAWRYSFSALVRSPAHPTHCIAASIEAGTAPILDDHFAHGGQFITGEFSRCGHRARGVRSSWLSPIPRPHLDGYGYYQRCPCARLPRARDPDF